MGKSNRCRNNDQGRIEFRDSMSVLRTLFGGVMALFGSFFFVVTIVGLFRPGGWEAAMARPGNTLGILAFTTFFFVVGWFAVFHRRNIVIDVPAREIAVVSEVFPFKRAKNHKLADFRAVVMVTEKTLSTKSSPSQFFYSVRMIKPDKDWVMLASLGSITDASELGNKVAEILGVELIEMSQAQWDNFS